MNSFRHSGLNPESAFFVERKQLSYIASPTSMSWRMNDWPDDPFPFAPVPGASPSHDGWTQEWQGRFIHALS